jgi:hypothetical protein
LAANPDSVLGRLPPEELSAGIAAVRKHARTSLDPVTEPIDLCVFRL